MLACLCPLVAKRTKLLWVLAAPWNEHPSVHGKCALLGHDQSSSNPGKPLKSRARQAYDAASFTDACYVLLRMCGRGLALMMSFVSIADSFCSMSIANEADTEAPVNIAKQRFMPSKSLRGEAAWAAMTSSAASCRPKGTGIP